jgi:hypothetical protein
MDVNFISQIQIFYLFAAVAVIVRRAPIAILTAVYVLQLYVHPRTGHDSPEGE